MSRAELSALHARVRLKDCDNTLRRALMYRYYNGKPFDEKLFAEYTAALMRLLQCTSTVTVARGGD